MPDIQKANAVRLEFAPGARVQTNLSGAGVTGDWLWVAGDQACGLDRLRRLDSVGRKVLRFGEVRNFPLANLLDLPGTNDEEADLEGMGVADGYLWVVGSHGHKRKNAKPVSADSKANLLARALAEDPHIAPYMAMLVKDNGFDIEVGRRTPADTWPEAHRLRRYAAA